MKTLLTAGVALWVFTAPANATPWFTDATANLPASAHGFASMDAVAADLDGDGDLDLVTPQEWRPNRILINDGHARFTLAAALPALPPEELVRPSHIQQPLQRTPRMCRLQTSTATDALI